MAPAADVARRLAFDVVLAVESDDAYANLLLARLTRERRTSPRDAAFAAEVAYGTLRWQGVLDEVVAAAALRPVEVLDGPVRAALRIGAYQLLHMRTPPHAAVHATVELARAVAGPKPVGFVNAVLRKVGQATWPQWVDRLAPAGDELGRLAFAHGQPRWIAAELLAALDGDIGELTAALAEDRPVTHLVARPGRIDRATLLAEAGEGAVPGPWSPYAVRLEEGGDPGRIAAVRSGAAAVQDEGSQLAALALAALALGEGAGGGAGERWLDMCAGPGGKAALLAGLLPSDGMLVAGEIRPHRAALVRRSLRPAPGGMVPGGTEGRTAVIVADGTEPPWRDGSFDRVLVDAPCTGLGALRRRPEVRWRRTAADVTRLRPLQEALLTRALDAVRPGGVVGYVTCSPVRAETREVVDAVLARRPGVHPVDPRDYLPELARSEAAERDLQLWPHRHGTDAMFVAMLRSEHV